METLEDWLAYQQRLHSQAIELGLERVATVWQRLGAPRLAGTVISVAGTNGKGSCVAMLEAMLSAAGHATGCYTSPHLVRYNERVRVRGCEVDDASLIAAFERIEIARGEITLTWFEFGTLAAFLVFAGAKLDVAVLEVGLGGRLDAVNIIDADAAIVTSIALDHVEYLGADRDSIGREKAGIFRAERVAIVGDLDPPRGLLDASEQVGAKLLRAGVDFRIDTQAGACCWHMQQPSVPETTQITIDAAALRAPGAPSNVAAALAALFSLRERLGWHPQLFATALHGLQVPGRTERIASAPDVVVDVAHNPQAAAALAAWLDGQPPCAVTVAVFSALSDKDIPGIAAALGARITHWCLCPLPEAGSRSLDPVELQRRLQESLPEASCSKHAGPRQALASARQRAGAADRVVAFGSFHLVGALLSRQL